MASEDLRKLALRTHLPSPLGATKAPWALSEEETEEIEELEGGETVSELSAPKASSSTSFGFSSKHHSQVDYSPLSASAYFAQALEVQPPESDTVFRVYLTAPLLSHSTANGSESGSGGAGAGSKGSLVVCHHGAGASGLSFAALAREVRDSSRGELGVLAFDARGHGKTRTAASPERASDVSLPTLLSDLIGVIEHLYPEPKAAPALLLLGHSMGACPILSAAPVLQGKGYEVSGVVVIDVVEGTAVESLPLMKSILAKRPESFNSVEDGIEWHINSHSIRNVESARVSVPSYLTPATGEETGSASGSSSSKQVWRTDLLATEPYWTEWYAGLSQRFLRARCARMLVLAGQERLDKELMIGQMQGKFQLEVLPDVGHYLHEDDPAALASLLVSFWRRNTQVLKLPPKVGAVGNQRKEVEVKRVGER